MSDSTSYACAAITQLRKLRSSTTPTLRIDSLASSPYPTYTQAELDMRRKAEILQYNSNYQSTKQNGLTKKEKYTQIVRGTYQSKVTNTTTICPYTMIITPSTSSGVPGKAVGLYLDPSIPLYNYQTKRNYTLQQTTDDRKCNIVNSVNVVCPNILNSESNPETYIGSIYFRDGIDDISYTITITAPISISFAGVNNTTSEKLLAFNRQVVDLTITNPKLIVYYNGTSLNDSGISKQVIPSYTLDCVTVSLDTINSGEDDFYGNVFVGNATFSNINLYSKSGYVYDLYVQLSANLNLNDDVEYTQSSYFTSITYNAIFNSDILYYQDSSNCVVSSPSTLAQQGITFFGESSIGTSFTIQIDSDNGYSSSPSQSTENVDVTTLGISKTYSGTATSSTYYKTGIAFGGGSPYYGSKTTITLDSTSTYITIKSDGDPYPAKASDLFTNDLSIERIWSLVPNPLTEQNFNYKFMYRGGTNTSASTDQYFFTTLGVQGIFLNGVALYNPSSGTGTVPGTTISGNNTYPLNAVFFEEQYGIDIAGGHPSPEGNIVNNYQGQYHYHDGMFLTSDSWNNSTFASSNSYFMDSSYNGDYIRHTDGHSKIVGFCFDGYPIYGPYGYVNASNASSGTMLMTPSYSTMETAFDGRPYSYTTSLDGYTLMAGAFLDDYEYISGSGTLDEHNGRYGITPDYPNGTYAYFITINEENEPVFPYIIGKTSKQSRTVTNYGYVGMI